MKKRLLLIMCLCLLAGTKTFAYDISVGGLLYNLSGSEATVTFDGVDHAEGGYIISSYYAATEFDIPATITDHNNVLYSVTGIGLAAFEGCSIGRLTIPVTVRSVGKNAFKYCSLGTVQCNAINIPTTSADAFNYSNISAATLYVPEISVNSYRTTAPWSNFGLIIAIGSDASSYVRFSDATVKALCVAHWDTNGDGYLSKAEAAAVTSIGKVFQNTNISSFNEFQYFTGVTTIGYEAFDGCESLRSITIPNSVTYIDEDAFYGCSSLTSINIPSSVTAIDSDAFLGCSSLASIRVEEGNTKFDSRDNCNAIIVTATNTLFKGCKNTIIPSSVTSIRSYAFYGCSGLTSVTIPNSVTSIGYYAFQYCNNLTSVVSEIETPYAFGSNAFANISSYCKLTVPYGKKDAYIAAGWTTSVFKGGITEAAPKNIVFADAAVKTLCVANWDTDSDEELSREEAAAVTSLGTVFKNNTTISSFDELGYFTGLTSIDYQTFYNCSNLISITAPNSVTSIGSYAFYGCSGLASMTIPNSVTSIGACAFHGCSSLTYVYIPNSVTSIGNSAFSGCSELTSVTIPNRVTSIDRFTFSNCSGLTYIEIPSSVTSIGLQAFSGCSVLADITIPYSVTDISTGAFDGTAWYNNQPDGIVYAGNVVYKYKGTMPEHTYITIKEGTKTIGTSAFSSCSGLTSVTIPSSVTRINISAFSGCRGLSSVTIPSSVKYIGNNAFLSCSGLTSIVSEIEEPFTFGSSAFYGVGSTCTLAVPYGTRDAYIAAGWTEDVFKGGIIEMAASTSVKISLGTTGIATYCSKYALDFSGISDIKAYIASGFDPTMGNLLLTRVTEVPAGEGLYITGTPGEYDIPKTTTDMVYSNLLKGVTTATTISPADGDKTNFILANGSHGVGFYTLSTSGELAAGKAYLQLPTASLSSGVKALRVLLDDEDDDPTGIAIIEDREITTDNSVFNLAGQRLSKAQKGVNIIKGKKVFIK